MPCSNTATTTCRSTAWPTLPAGGGKFNDPDYGTEIMRLTDDTDRASPEGCRTAYSYWPTLNVNNTRAIAQCVGAAKPVFYVLNQPTFTRGAQTIPTSALPDYNNGAYWDAVNPDLIYAMGSVSTILYQYNVATDTVTVKKDFSSYLPAGRYLIQPAMSDDNSIIALVIKRTSDFFAIGFFAFNLNTNTVLFNSEAYSVNDPNEAHLTSDGRYMSVDLDIPQRQTVYDLQNGGANLGTIAITDDGPSHNTLALTEMITNTAYSTARMVKWPLTNFIPSARVDLGVNFAYTTTGTIHISNLALNKNWTLVSHTDKTSAVVSTGYDAAATSIVLNAGGAALLNCCGGIVYQAVWWNNTDYPNSPASDPNMEFVNVTAHTGETLTVTRGYDGTTASAKNIVGKTYKMAPAGPFHDEVFLLSTTGNGAVYRFLHAHAIFSAYDDSAFGNISRDGKFVAFSSNNNESGRRDLFIASIPNSPAGSGIVVCNWHTVPACS